MKVKSFHHKCDGKWIAELNDFLGFDKISINIRFITDTIDHTRVYYEESYYQQVYQQPYQPYQPCQPYYYGNQYQYQCSQQCNQQSNKIY